MAFTTQKSHVLFSHLGGVVARNSKIAHNQSLTFRFLCSQNHLSPTCQRRRKGFNQFESTTRPLHDATNASDSNAIDDTLFKIGVIEIDNEGNSETKNIRLETLVNELRATEKSKLDKILNERTEKDLYAWSRTGMMERKSILSKEYQKQKRSQIPLRDLRMFFRHINLGK